TLSFRLLPQDPGEQLHRVVAAQRRDGVGPGPVERDQSGKGVTAGDDGAGFGGAGQEGKTVGGVLGPVDDDKARSVRQGGPPRAQESCLVFFGIARETFLSRWLHPVLERSEEHTSELQSRFDLVCRLLL